MREDYWLFYLWIKNVFIFDIGDWFNVKIVFFLLNLNRKNKKKSIHIFMALLNFSRQWIQLSFRYQPILELSHLYYSHKKHLLHYLIVLLLFFISIHCISFPYIKSKIFYTLLAVIWFLNNSFEILL